MAAGAARRGQPRRDAAASVGQLRSGNRHGRGAALSALRQHAERRGGAEAARGARGRGGGARARRAGWARRRARCSRCSARATICSRARGSMADARGCSREEFDGARASTSRSSIRSRRACWRKRMRKETRAIFVESPVNPTCRVLDLKPLSLPDARERARARRRLDVREPDQPPAARARRRRRHPLGDEVPQRPPRRAGRRGAAARRRTSRKCGRR